MIRSEHSIVEYDFRSGTVIADRLLRGRDSCYIDVARRLLQVYGHSLGEIRQTVHARAEACFSGLPGCPPRRVAAFCKLLDDQATYDSDPKAAVALRRRVFELAAPLHPIVQTPEGIFDNELHAARTRIAAQIGIPWAQIESTLFNDVIELQPLTAFESELTPPSLLSLYNVAQTQAALYRATSVCIDATSDFKTILKHAKLAGLMHRITRLKRPADGFRFELDGAQSSLRETSRYGVRFAALLPKLLACEGWRMKAQIIGPNRRMMRMELSPSDGLHSVLDPPDAFDSGLEHDVDAAWKSAPVDGWKWGHEAELLYQGQTVMTPDFSLRNDTRNILVYVEVVGFWTPEYLAEKCLRLKQFTQQSTASSDHQMQTKWLLIIPKKLPTSGQTQLADLGIPIIRFDKKSRGADWIQAVL
ncbi:DUF790 family protein [Stieleria sp. TO1_6]|uniref:DUF790 family protein n=1 Tax=Stieleria tagensis TaxID=2956795 RepID=UPI00209B19F0|nr:DUF790 family protein [Stieleria tagensis]MCO8122637.1 DUF790 family protein [Stieleria tagensis]